jgi:hypothetical protein
MVWFEHPTQAAWLGAATLVGVVSVFVIGKKSEFSSTVDEKQMKELDQLESLDPDS